mmetsp:Transcript_8723/g.12105  ORF Transcript_8723/g.12105 Transcript_8723/m.12105 type:complete len:260 (-) Transcript_8723:126-905(-)|eukprot:CAMPEP_0197314174 /NCGR_PEP_ID=MMETSP0891-20130614/32512_1 /TAXON_ID=44058 ORGANISM="Aureoumbra lagunensis, Strain CCMP1510" /NCGR_SAMPLE_ID=MMETSP0891 /ASSEMBLY_ACC=CAM_ASM_000534 /LENGTH=259 /DNA_ID=CAMNT_0042802471 /DNA_START=27 /DNA_END=806 /DNA_ORIENTATION=-
MVCLVFVHGCQHKASYWKGMQEIFSERDGLESIAVELSVGRFCTIETYLDDLRSQIFHLNAEELVFVGHSIGALIVQSHIATGGIGKALVLLAPVPLDPNLLFRHAFGLALQTPITNLTLSTLTQNSKHVMAPNLDMMKYNFFLPSTKSTTRIDKDGQSLDEYYTQQITHLDSAGAALWNCRGNARDISIPTLVLAAAQDKLIQLETVRDLVKIFPQNLADLKIIENQAHAFADPDWESSVCEPIRNFLADKFLRCDGY